MIAKDPGTFPVSSIPQSAYPEGSPSVLPSVISFRAGSEVPPSFPTATPGKVSDPLGASLAIHDGYAD